tara:strand:+ start:3613 stop:4131 length:519 start_codon:yes stop_codon:yes gene_type:complete
MIDNHRFVDAYFVNNEKTVLKTEWLDESGTIIRPYIIEVDKDPDVYKKFMKTKDLELMEINGEPLKKITEDWIHERTYNKISEQRKNYERELVKIAKANNEYNEVVTDSGLNHDLLLQYLDNTMKTSDKEVFTLKMKIFEKDQVKQSENRGLKAKLRKAKTIGEVIGLYLEF